MRHSTTAQIYLAVLELESIYEFLGDYISSRKNNKLVTLQFCVLQGQHENKDSSCIPKTKWLSSLGRKPVTF